MKIIGGIATILSREDILKRVLDSIVPQVDMLFVALNGYDKEPEWLHKTYNINCVKVTTILSDNSKGDAMKFAMADIPDCYFLSFDDDLQYPTGYVEKMVGGVEKYKALVSLHGRKYSKGADFKHWVGNYRCLNTVERDVYVNLIGSGCAAFSTNQLRLSLDMFETTNKADCYLSRAASQQGVPMVVLAHQRDYLTYLHPKDTIWTQTKNYSVHNQILRSYIK